jgi:hypothetical protein
MIEISKNSIVYLVCPPVYASGGPELMYQLANKLESYGVNAFIFYLPKHEDPVHPNYKAYKTKFVDVIEDHKKNLIIVPEALVSSFNMIDDSHAIRKCIWWLSVDNFFKKIYKRTLPRNFARFPALRDLRIFENRFFAREVKDRKYDYHLVQSQYAYQFLRKNKITAGYLSDYLNATFFERAGQLQAVEKEDIVLYNPKKGLEFTRKIIEKSANLTWMPIQNMTPNEVADLLARAKVYIDFGSHPGKDRFPREAAIMNCCIITSKNGSACYDEDVNIPEEYKISDSRFNIGKTIALIKSCLDNFEQHTNDFEGYRKNIRQEEQRFINDIKAIFSKTETEG